MSILSVVALIVIVFVLAWRFEETLLGVLPFAICALGLVLYILAFFRRMSLIDWILIVGAALAICLVILEVRKKGAGELLVELKRQFCDVHLWVSIVIIVVMCILLRGEKILEWDGYNFWGPDTRSLYFRDGFAPKFSNVASAYGDYPPMSQIIFWWFLHISGEFSEQTMFFAYYIFGALLMFSIADKFRAPRSMGQKEQAPKGARKWLTPVLACLGAVVLPGVVCTAWFRALCVDPLMAMLFGAVLCVIVCRPENPPKDGRFGLLSQASVLWKAKILVSVMCLTLIKSIGILWSVLALLFFFLWWMKERKEFHFALLCAGGVAVCYGSWAVFCNVMERSTYLVNSFSSIAADRIAEIRAGEFLSAGNNWGFITSYGRAFLLTPMHREKTFAIDLTPVIAIVILFVAAVVLYKFGFVPKKKLGRLLVFMALCFAIIYIALAIGQMTMFYYEEQYLNPINAVTLMTRYCAPANMGLLMLLCAFASGQAANRGEDAVATDRRGAIAAILTGVLLFSCGAYTEMGRRFVYDPYDEQRIELRRSFNERYGDFIEAVREIPLDMLNEEGMRVLLCYYDMPMNPIVINEASPVSFHSLALSGDEERDVAALFAALARGHERYLYIADCEDDFLGALSAYTENGYKPQKNTLYEIFRNEDMLISPAAIPDY